MDEATRARCEAQAGILKALAHPTRLFIVEELGRLFVAAAESGELRCGLDPAQATHLFLAGVYGYQVGTPGDHEETRRDLRAFIKLFLEPEAS